MALRVALRHSTRYHFDRPVTLSPHFIRLKPAPHCRTPIDAYSLHITGGPYFINWQQDPFGNHVARVVFPEKMTDLEVAVELILPMTVVNPFDFFLENYAEQCPFTYPDDLKKDLAPYLEITSSGPLLTQWLAGVSRQPRPTAEFLVALNQRLVNDLTYLVRMEPGVQDPEDTLQWAQGSCRDSAWLMVQIMRHLGLAARFVSGYLIQLTADERAVDGPSGTEVDFTDLHAWVEVYVPGAGWIGLDTTSGLFAGEGHVPLAATPAPGHASPISGSSSTSDVTLEHTMTVTRVHEAPRVSKPYSDDQWQAILALGSQVDDTLNQQHLAALPMSVQVTFLTSDGGTVASTPPSAVMSDPLWQRLDSRFDERSGVLTVRTEPATTWPESVQKTDALYEQARAQGLHTEQFMLDGHHAAVGGQPSITLGGPDSPLLQRLDVINSLQTLWQRHPALAHCFGALDAPDATPGVITLRDFDMPPHPRMNLMHQLFLRTLVAYVAAVPCAGPPIAWGAALEDRWLLPHYLWEDLRDVVSVLRQRGFDVDLDWLAPFLIVSCPPCGTVQVGSISIELRQALEPGARPGEGALGRLQVKATGLTPGRHLIACNGQPVPLHNTGTTGEAVSGVRFRAWPSINADGSTGNEAVDAPLIFDLVDTWNQRSIGGCTYHVWDPAGRNHTHPPINANEADARRLARFWQLGHTQGPMSVTAPEPHGQHPNTLDLTRNNPNKHKHKQ